MRSIFPSTLAVLLTSLVTTAAPAQESVHRALVAVMTDSGEPYLGWRLLAEDPPDVAFNVYRQTDDEAPVRVNPQPITHSTNLLDSAAPAGRPHRWFVRAVIDGQEMESSEVASLPANAPPDQVRTIALQGDYDFNRVGIADLDGDGILDYVIKQPGSGHGLDPGTIRHSPDTFKLEAYNGATGEFMWRYDLGWNMTMGVWWTPYITGDFDGDGRDEVALKMAPYAATPEEALIDEGGFVLEGPEYLLVLDGETGEEIARADWIERGDPERWGDPRGNRVNRNQIGAVVGSQPFGGEGLSGTGPKAGGPHYLPRLSRPLEMVPPSTANNVLSGLALCTRPPTTVIPAKAGTHFSSCAR